MAFERDAFQNDLEGVFLPGFQVELILAGASPVKGPTRKTSLAGTASVISEALMWEGYDDGIYDGVGFYDDDAFTIPTQSPSIVGDDSSSQELVVGVPRAVTLDSGKNDLVEV